MREACDGCKWFENGNCRQICYNFNAYKAIDNVNHPSHYTFGKFEVIDVLEDWFPDKPLLFNAGKYLARAFHKGKPLEDLKKARWMIDRQIKHLEEET